MTISNNQKSTSISPFRHGLNSLLRKRVAMSVIIVLLIVYIVGLFAPLIAPYSYSETDLMNTQSGPTWDHIFGTDRLGRDIFTRIIWGIQTTVIITIVGLITGSLILGVSLGLVAGYFRGKTDAVITRTGEVLAAFPDILLIIILAATLRPRIVDFARRIEDLSGISGIVSSGIVDFAVIGIALLPLSWFGMMRLVRGQVLSVGQREYVQAARIAGASNLRILFRHILPNVIGPIIVSASFGLGAVAGTEVFLSFLGLGVQPPHPSLGIMIADVTGRGSSSVSVLTNHPEQILAPIAVVWVLIFCWNLLGDALTDIFNPRSK
ncbi:MAG: ABC transporter permease [Chloroflexota bacterium]|nr:ABC transporter permease [Chloroflexota bacterium]|tara:strand:+ start:43513 stop:44478 length:966 start_codon:yes stop_codon:yes gene_type:complete